MKRIITLSLFVPLLTVSIAAQNYSGPKEDIDAILAKAAAFSEAYMAKDFDAIARAYTSDGKIMPGNSMIISGREKIKQHWLLPDSVNIKLHELHPEEIKVLEDYAYDYGYYNGITIRPGGEEVSWKGKYVVVWKRVEGDWLMYIDIWNNVRN